MVSCVQVWLLLHLLLLSLGQIVGSVGEITSLKINANIEHRYAVTQVTTAMKNTNGRSAKLQFQTAMPNAALVSSLIMEIAGTNYTGIIRKKSASRRIYEMAQMKGKTTGVVEQVDDAVQKFVASINVAAHETVTFYMTYEELVKRVDGSYLYSTYIHPGYRIPMVNIDVHILEREEIIDYKILEMPGQEISSHNPGTKVHGGPMSLGELYLHYHHDDPHDGTGRGVQGVFTVSYDITHYPDGGEVQRVGNYFTHYFSPEGLPKIQTHTVFLLDVSYSMHSGRLDALQTAMASILKGLDVEDTFELLAFSSDVVNVGSFSGEHQQVKKGVRKVKRLVSMGYSNLNAAVLQAIRTANSYNNPQAIKQIVVFTDGQATSGVTDPETIRKNVKEANSHKHPIFSFIFGNNDMKLLERISRDSSGFARYTHHGSTLASQIKAFYKEISKPLLKGVDITYSGTSVDLTTVVRPGISNYYSGQEFVLAGLLIPGALEVHPIVNGMGKDGPYQFPVTRVDARHPFHTSLTNNFTARLWAYLIVKDLLAIADASENVNHTQELHAQAFRIALRFGFVTQLTSLVVVYPDDEYIVVSPQDQLHRERNRHPNNYYESSISGYRRTGRSNIRGNRPQEQVDLDPHFIVYAQGLELPLCFDYHGHNGAIMNLIRDPVSGIIVNGQVTSSAEWPRLTYFTSLFFRLGKVNITITPDRMEVDCLGEDGTRQVKSITKSLWPFYKKNGRRYKHGPDKKLRTLHSKTRQPMSLAGQKRGLGINHIPQSSNVHHTYIRTNNKITNRPDNYFSYNKINNQNNVYGRDFSNRLKRLDDEDSKFCQQNSTWEEGVGRIYGDVMIVLNKKQNLHVTMGDGLAHFAVVRSKNRSGQQFLGFYIKDQQILSAQTHGIIGQFTTKSVRLISPTTLAVNRNNNTENTVKVEVNRRTRKNKHRLSLVSGVLYKRRSLLEETHVECIHIPGKGRGLLDGQPKDYLLNCLHC